jgi:hypothetical protein
MSRLNPSEVRQVAVRSSKYRDGWAASFAVRLHKEIEEAERFRSIVRRKLALEEEILLEDVSRMRLIAGRTQADDDQSLYLALKQRYDNTIQKGEI